MSVSKNTNHSAGTVYGYPYIVFWGSQASLATVEVRIEPAILSILPLLGINPEDFNSTYDWHTLFHYKNINNNWDMQPI